MGQQVTKILFSSTGTVKIATGVQFGTATGPRFVAFARKEVIVAAGAIGVSVGSQYRFTIILRLTTGNPRRNFF